MKRHVEERKLFQLGASLAFTLPNKWVREHNLRAGDTVILIRSESQTIHLMIIQTKTGKEV